MSKRRYSPRTTAPQLADPGSDLTDTPAFNICINEEWVPHITGALETLRWPDYWKNPDYYIDQVDQLIDFLNGQNQGNCGHACPSAIMVIDPDDPQVTIATEYDLPTAGCTFPPEAYSVHVYPLPEMQHFTHVSCKFMKNLLNVGVRIRTFQVFTDEFAVGGTILFVYQGCDGQEHIQVIPSFQFRKDQFVCKNFKVSCTDRFTVLVTLYPQIECSPA